MVASLRSSRRDGPIVPYVPRRPVPWGVVGCALAMVYLLMAVFSALERTEPASEIVVSGVHEGAEVESSSQVTEDGARADAADQAAGALSSVFICAGFVFVIAVLYRATPSDVGLPTSATEFAQDAFVGVVACVAAIAPVHVLQVLLRYLLNMKQGESGHELIKMLEDNPNVALMAVASTVAVVVAPLCEELTFRLLLQGWLEKWEDLRLGWRTPAAEVSVGDEQTALTNGSVATSSEPASLAMSDPPRLGLWGLPYGWLPILVSATIFGLAHLGYGPEPVPIFLLGLFLGYLYQRTHRIAPSIVCHAAFNLFTMSQLWWRYLSGTP